MMRALVVVAALCATSEAFAADPPMSAAECAVWTREHDFAKSVDDHDARAFASFLHQGAVFNVASSSPVRGRDAVVAAWADIVSGAYVLQWRPRFVSIGGDPNVAASRGPYVTKTSDGKYLTGTFSSVWVRSNAHAPWLILFDGAAGAPTPVPDEAAAKAFLDAAPEACAPGKAS